MGAGGAWAKEEAAGFKLMIEDYYRAALPRPLRSLARDDAAADFPTRPWAARVDADKTPGEGKKEEKIQAWQRDVHGDTSSLERRRDGPREGLPASRMRKSGTSRATPLCPLRESWSGRQQPARECQMGIK